MTADMKQVSFKVRKEDTEKLAKIAHYKHTTQREVFLEFLRQYDFDASEQTKKAQQQLQEDNRKLLGQLEHERQANKQLQAKIQLNTKILNALLFALLPPEKYAIDDYFQTVEHPGIIKLRNIARNSRKD